MRSTALALLAALCGCAVDDAATDAIPQTALTDPHPRFDAEYTTYLRERFRFEDGLVNSGNSRYSLEVPTPKEVPLLVVALHHTTAIDHPCGEFPRGDAELAELVFGVGSPTLRGYFDVESHDRMRIDDAGIVHVCLILGSDTPEEKIARAVPAAALQHSLLQYDRDGDGYVWPEELAILVLEDTRGERGGAARRAGQWYGYECVALPGGGNYCGDVAVASGGGALTTWVHELGHAFGAEDLYAGAANVRSSLYGAPTAALLLSDAWNRFRRGWIRPEVVDLPAVPEGEAFLICADEEWAEVDGSLLLFDRDRGNDQFFLLEARCDRGYDEGIDASGVAIWQVQQRAAGRWGDAHFDVTRRYADGDVVTPSVCLHASRRDGSDVCRNRTFLDGPPRGVRGLPLRWGDGTPTGYEVRSEPEIEYIDHGIPGHHHDPHLVGYRVWWWRAS